MIGEFLLNHNGCNLSGRLGKPGLFRVIPERTGNYRTVFGEVPDILWQMFSNDEIYYRITGSDYGDQGGSTGYEGKINPIDISRNSTISGIFNRSEKKEEISLSIIVINVPKIKAVDVFRSKENFIEYMTSDKWKYVYGGIRRKKPSREEIEYTANSLYGDETYPTWE